MIGGDWMQTICAATSRVQFPVIRSYFEVNAGWENIVLAMVWRISVGLWKNACLIFMNGSK